MSSFEILPNRLLVKRNTTCPYCGHLLSGADSWDQDHVIGRRFVPRGTLATSWNLVLRSCRCCNAAKADLENDVSAITMQPNTAGRFATDDSRLAVEAKRKGRATSKRTQRWVAEPEDPILFQTSMGPLNFKFKFHAPAQVDDDRAYQLARMQLRAFHYLTTYDEIMQRGYYWPGTFAPLLLVRHSDWGNPLLGWFERTTACWALRVHSVAADGFHKIWIRRRIDDPAVWAWAMEWNFNFRLAGFFGNEEAIRAILSNASWPELHTVVERPNRTIKFRLEAALQPEEDTLFELDETLIK